MPKHLLPFFGIALMLASGCSKKNEFQPPPPPEVGVQQPAMKNATVYRTFPGRLSASDSVDVRARVVGFLETIEFTDGEVVEKDKLLFTIEPEQYEVAVQAAEAKLAQAKAALELADATLQRNEKAFETRAISEVDLLTAEANRQSAEAAVMAAEAALEKARIDLSYTKIHAPFPGRLANSRYSAGNLVGTGDSSLLTTLVVESPIDVYFNVDERTLLELAPEGGRSDKPGGKVPPVRLELADGTAFDEEGRVNYSDPEIDPATGTLRIRARFANESLKLRPGMYGKILVPQEIEHAILVPEKAIQRDLSGSYVLIVNADSKVESKYVERGALVGTERIIESGLDGNEQIIVSGMQRARPGIPVRVAPATSAE